MTGDGGETNSYRKLIESNLFGDISIQKLECVEYAHKKLGTRFRALLIKYKGIEISDWKRLSAPGCLTTKVINTLKNYFGMARSQNESVPEMSKTIGAVLFHVLSMHKRLMVQMAIEENEWHNI